MTAFDVDPVAYLTPLVEGRTPPANPNPPWSMTRLREYLLQGMMERPYERCLIHMPQGWVHTMAGGGWHAMTVETQAVYAEVIGQVLAEKPGYQVSVYNGFQFYSAYTNVGRPRPPGEQFGYIGEPAWADADDRQTVRGIRDLTVQPWADIGVTGWVFDSGSHDPREIVRWKNKLRRVVPIVGLETIPWMRDHLRVDWWAATRGVQYHGLTRAHNGEPFRQRVPPAARGMAFVWINHPPVPSAVELGKMIRLGWTPVLNRAWDDLMAETLVLLDRHPDVAPMEGGRGD